MIMLIYRHGQVRSQDAARAAMILQMFCLGMWAYVCRHILLRAFFCQKDIATPLKISCVLAVANILLVAIGVFTPLRGGAIGLATAATAIANVLWLTSILRRRWGRIDGQEIFVSLSKTLLATAVMALAVWLVRLAYGRAPETTKQAGLIVAASVTLGGLAFLVTAVLLRCRELGELWPALRRRGNGDADTPRDVDV